MKLILTLIREKASKLGCFLLIGILMGVTVLITRQVLWWFKFDEGTSSKIAHQAGNAVGITIIVLMLCLGVIALVREFKMRSVAKTEGVAPAPPPLPAALSVSGGANNQSATSVRSPDTSTRGCFKACAIAAGACVLLVSAGLSAIWYMASLHEKRPKQPGEWELHLAEESIRSFENKEAFGNTPAAEELAEGFARQLRVVKQLTLSDPGGIVGDFTKGRFLTYCSEKPDSVALIVHVPGLRRFAEDAKLTLEEDAWILASHWVSSKRPQVTKLALGLKGDLDYSSIVTGRVNAGEPLKGIETRHPTYSTKPLWSFFLPGVHEAEKQTQ